MAAKYTEDDVNELGKKGQAFKNPDGSYSYPIADSEDLDNAIHAVGRGNADHDAIRKYIIGRAKALGLSSKIPDNWNADGSMSDEKSDNVDAETRADCPTCDGKGTIKEGHVECPDCKGSGVAPESKSDSVEIEVDGQEMATSLQTALRRKPRHRSGLPTAPEFRRNIGGIEVRRMSADGLEVRSGGGDGDIVEIAGTPIAYNTPYTVTDAFGEFSERMAPGVATNVLAKNADVRLLVDHDSSQLLARTLSGTLSLTDSPTGLQMVAQLDTRDTDAMNTAIRIERGDLSQMSCGFIVANDTWNDDMTDRTIHRFSDLLDVSCVTYPASPTTSVAIAERMMMEAPVESRARVRRMWSVSKELRSGRQLTPESAALMMDGLEVLATADEHVENALLPEPEDRAAPTAEDAAVLKAITAAHGTTAAALHAQAKDPDNNSDPVDKKVMGHLTAAHGELTQALAAQGKDGTPDDNSLPAVGGPDGSQGSSDQGGQGLQDGTGSREDETPKTTRTAASLRLEMELLELRRR